MTDDQTQGPKPFPVAVHLERWDGRDEIERVSSVIVGVEDVVAELDGDAREDLAQAAAMGRTDLDWVYERAVDLALVEPHDGPYTVDLDPLAEWLEANPRAMDRLRRQTRRTVVPGRPLVAPVDVDEALLNASADGFLEALVRVPFDDLLTAAASGDDSWDEHDLLAAKVSPLLPYDSDYLVKGLVPVADGQPDLLVLFTSNVVRAAAMVDHGSRED